MKKWTALSLSAIAIVSLALAGCASPQDDEVAPEVSSSIDWKQFEGEQITLLFNAHPWTDAMEKRLDEFETLTGISVDLQTYSEDLYDDRRASALRADPGVADAYFLGMDDGAFSEFENGLVSPLGKYIEDPKLTADDYDFEDFPAGLIDAARFPFGDEGAEPYGIPIVTEAFILYYNKELIDEYLDGVVPENMNDLLVAAEKISQDSGGEISGSVMRGVRSAGIRDPLTSVVLNGFGDLEAVHLPENVWFAEGFDTPRLDDPAIVDGVDAYARLVAAGPTNALSLDWPDAVALFAQGRAAFMIDSTAFSPTFENPDESLVAGKVGYAPIPPSTQGQGTGLAAWALGIPENSQHKEAAWYFIQWATNKFNTAEFGQSTGGAARVSSAEDEGYLEALNPEFVEASAKALEHAVSSAVYREGWSEQMLIIVDAMQDISKGADPQTRMSDANVAMEKALGVND